MKMPGLRIGLVALVLATAPGAVRSDGVTYHVATGGVESASGLDWEHALRTISNAVARAGDGDIVLVSNGTYAISAPLELTNGVTLRSLEGGAFTTIRRAGPASHRIITCTHAGAVIDGFTIRDGRSTSANGGGLHMTGGQLRNCIVASNSAYDSSFGGGGAYLAGRSSVSNCVFYGNSGYHYGGGLFVNGTGVVVRNCILSNNVAFVWGGGAYLAYGTLVNCLVVRNGLNGNHSSYGGGGICMLNSSRLLHCTVANNAIGYLTPGGGVLRTGGAITNCIVYHNWRGTLADDISGAGNVAYSCASGLTGPGNTAVAPDFVDAAADNYHVRPGSVCIDSATNAGVGADFAGSPRPLDGRTAGEPGFDMGAYEEPPVTAGVFRCGFAGLPLRGTGVLTSVFTAQVGGSNTAGVSYTWDFENDGTPDAEGPDRRTVTNTYASPGLFSVRLRASNELAEADQVLRPQYVVVGAQDLFVSTNGAHQPPYTNWATAATNLAAAVALAGDGSTISVSGGLYQAVDVTLSEGVTIQGVDGAAATVVTNSGWGRLFRLTHSNATLRGLTLTGGKAVGSSGAAAWLESGLVEDCIVRGNSAPDNLHGGALYVQGAGRVRNCTVFANSGFHYGAIRLDAPSGVVERCIVSNNSGFVWGGGLHIVAGMARNCLVVRNRVTGNNGSYGGGGVTLVGGQLVNCTIANNSVGDVTPGGGVRRTGGGMTNCIVFYNRKGPIDNNVDVSTAGIGFSCAPELALTNGNTVSPPEFVARSADDYRLLPNSPCLDTGVGLASVTQDLTGAVRPRDGDGDGVAACDMGAYEMPDAASGPLTANFLASTNTGMDALDVTFAATVTGANTNGLYAWWDFDGDGANDREGEGLLAVTHPYDGPGIFDVRLLVANEAQETATVYKADMVSVYASRLHVYEHGGHQAPYTNWAMAATNLSSVLFLAGDGSVVLITNGIYAAAELRLMRGMTLRSVMGPEFTIITNSGSGRLFDVYHPGCSIERLTLTGGKASGGSGGAVRLNAGGAVRGCVVRGNTAMDNVEGGAIMAGPGSYVGDCNVFDNRGGHYSGGIYLSGGSALVERCIMSNNTALIWGAGLFGNAGTARNCLIVRNSVVGNHTQYGGGGVRLMAARLENCTIVHNSCPIDSHAGGVWMAGGSITNCIVYDNPDGGTNNDIEAAGYAAVGFTCSPGLTAGTNGNIVGRPIFMGTNTLNYRLAAGSPGINAGVALPWSSGAIDLDGGVRVRSGGVDMGAYEFAPGPGSMVVIR